MEERRILQIDAAQAGERLDRALVDEAEGLTRSAVQKLLERGMITVNGKPATKNTKLKCGDVVEMILPEPQEITAKPEHIPLDIVYEDSDLLVVNKPKGMVVHPAPGHTEGTLVNALLAHCGDSLSGINGELRPGIVHRIDKDTSGLLIVAKNDLAHHGLAEQIQVHSFTREYQAVVYGTFKQDSGTVDAPIGRDPNDRKRMTVTNQHARNAVTHYRVQTRYQGFTHLVLRLETGRTHQIRVHMAHLGHPVAGDPVYGPKKIITRLEGQCLHAGKIGVIHPRSGAYLEFEAPLPEYFTSFIRGLTPQE